MSNTKLPPGTCQSNIIIPIKLKEAIQRVARLRALERDEKITYTDILKELLTELAILSGSYVPDKE